MDFPCSFPIKAIGKDTQDFEAEVLSLVQAHVPAADCETVRRRASHGGRYTAVTVTIRARSQDQLDAVYRALSGHERVIMAL